MLSSSRGDADDEASEKVATQCLDSRVWSGVDWSNEQPAHEVRERVKDPDTDGGAQRPSECASSRTSAQVKLANVLMLSR